MGRRRGLPAGTGRPDRRPQSGGDLGAGFRGLRVECPDPVVERSIAERDGVSDADLENHRQFRDRFEPVEMDHAVVDNWSEAGTRRQVDAVLRRWVMLWVTIRVPVVADSQVPPGTENSIIVAVIVKNS